MYLFRAPLFFLFLGSIFLQLEVKAFDMQQYRTQNPQPNLTVFLKNFPYNSYLNSVQFTDFQTLQSHRRFLWSEFGDGDDFLYYLGENFIRLYPVTLDPQNLDAKIQIGEAFIAPKNGFNQGINEIYQIIGYFILGKVAQEMKQGILTKKFDTKTPSNEKLIKRLENNKVYVSIEEGNASKLIKKVKEKDWKYILDRVVSKVHEYYQPTTQIISEKTKFSDRHVFYAMMGILVVFFVLGGSFRQSSYLFFVILTLSPFFLKAATKPSSSSSNGYICNPNAKFKLEFVDNYHRLPNSQEYAINLMKIRDRQNNQIIGQTVWMLRPNIKANYFAYQNVPQKYHNFRQRNQVVLATTGGFTNHVKKPEGFTVERGNIVNAVIMHDRHGLVMVQENGGIRILNLQNNNFDLPLSNTQTKTIDNPLHSLIAYSQLLYWCKQRKITLFQTQLLAFSDNMLIKKDVAKNQLRERRILALFSDKNSGEVHHAIFNIEASYNLAEIAEEIFCTIQSRNKKIEAILNLDVGSYNIMEVYNDSGQRILEGPVSVRNATNLIIYNKQ